MMLLTNNHSQHYLRLALAAVAICTLSFSCAREIALESDSIENGNAVKPNGRDFTAGFEDEISKLSINTNTGVVSWVAGDQINIFWASGNAGKTTTTAASAGTSTTFPGSSVADASVYYAAWPKNNGVYDGTNLKMTISNSQSRGFENSHYMAATTTAAARNFMFYSLVTLVKFQVAGTGYTKAVFQGGDGETVAGTVTLDFSSGVPEISAVTSGSKTVTCNSGGEFTTNSFHCFSILPNTFSNGFSVTLYKGDENPQQPIFITDEVVCSRAGYIDLGTIDSKSTQNLFVTPEGAGKKTGKNWDNALGTVELRELIKSEPDDADKSAFKASILDGVTFHMSEGDYFIAGAADTLVQVGFDGVSEKVDITFKGGYPAGKTGTDLSGRDTPAGSETTPTHCTAFTGNNVAGILQINNHTNATFEGITFKDSNLDSKDDTYGTLTATSGGADKLSTLNLSCCRFIGNIKNNGRRGGAVAINGANTTIDHCYFGDNQSIGGGGAAIELRTGFSASMTHTTVISNCTFKRNNGQNAAVENVNRAGVAISNCTFTNNEGVNYGGALYCDGGNDKTASLSTTTVTNCTFEGNVGGTKGGAVSIRKATVTLSDCTFTGNSCTYGSKWLAGKGEERTAGAETTAGGAISLWNANSVCSVTGCTFTGNSAPNGCGGAICQSMYGPTLTIGAGNTFTNNTAFFHGGAIFAMGNFTLTGTSGSKVTFTGNKTLSMDDQVANGGAIWLRDGRTYSLSYAVFNGCEAGQENSSNVNYSNGGAIAVRAVNTLSVSNCEFTACRGRNGGCLDLLPGSTSTINFNNCSFHDNICRSGASKNGTAGNFHGAVARIGGEGAVNFTSCTFEDNVAHHSGGVLHLNSETAVVNCSGCTFDDNSVSDTGSGYGGAISLEKGTLNMSGSCTVSDNTAKFAGALCIDDGTANLTASTFSGNSATNGNQALSGEANTAVADNVAGGAILLRNSASMCTLTDCTLSGNSAPNGCGGAIGRINTTPDNLRINLGTNFSDNTAYFHGGAIFSLSNVEINAKDASGSAISSASASAAHVTFDGDFTSCPTNEIAHGGAVYLKGGTSHFNYTEFSASKAGYASSAAHGFGGAVALSGNTVLRGSHCDFSSCRGRRGGAITMNNGAKSDLSDCRFYQNNTVDSWGSCIFLDAGDGAESLYLNRCIFESNTTTSRGVIAGSSNRPYIFYMNRVTFKNNSNLNTTGSNYGVIFHSNGGVLCMNNVTCVGNSTSNTDGDGNNFSFAGQKMLLVNSTFIDNVEGQIFRGYSRLDLCNNILINSKTSNNVINLVTGTPFNDNGYNLASCSNKNQAHATLSDLNKYGITSLGGGAWNGAWDAVNMIGDLVYAWNGTVASPFTFARQTNVESTITGFDVSNGNISHVGNDFLAWLRGCATDHTYDARDLARGSGDWWPGAYQGGPSRAAEVEPFDPLTPIDF